MPEHIVHCDQSTLPQQLQRALVIAIVILLIRIDEHEIERASSSLREQAVQRLHSRRQPKRDLMLDTGFAPIPPGHGSIFFAYVAGDDPTLFGQRQRHHGRAIAGKHAYFERQLRAQQSYQHSHELALLRGDLHHPVGHLGLRRAPELTRLCFPKKTQATSS